MRLAIWYLFKAREPAEPEHVVRERRYARLARERARARKQFERELRRWTGEWRWDVRTRMLEPVYRRWWQLKSKGRG